ncbi:MazG-like family protein [Streptacidiphilus carbonis]|uniref:MazG-like family protein n=1 Tax=Streptacidiphilus carbonis TaxID=105422 RepID=UPI0007C76C3A
MPAEPLNSTGAPDPWQTISALVAWLDVHNGSGQQETALRLLKVTEEAGEAAAAYIGATGQNPRKGTTHTAADVADELCDVIVSAMVALHSFTDRPAQRFTAKVHAIADRAAALPWCSCDAIGEGPCPLHPDPDNPATSTAAVVDQILAASRARRSGGAS